jgi:ubiquinone/menaquinone biosynthesis C-methylase UbiE
LEFWQGDASGVPFDADSFDSIYCRAAFKNFSELVRAINEMRRVLNPGGSALIVDLRKHTSNGEINTAIEEMRLDRTNSVSTKWIFTHVRLKRAYLQGRLQADVRPAAVCGV